MIVLCCPRCGNDIPDRDLSWIIRFYDGDRGLGAKCPECGAKVSWAMTFTIVGERQRI